MAANSHPRPLSLSTDWLNGTEYLHGLLLSAHSAENLSTTFQAFVSRRGAHLSSAQSIGIKRYKEERKNGRTGPREDEAKMHRFYDYLNEIFFCSSLKGLCAIKFIDRPFEEDANNVEHYSLALAYTPSTGSKNRMQIPDRYAALINMRDRSGDSPLLDDEGRLTGYLEVLLHEMLHVFFGFYECLCSDGCKTRHLECLGASGHSKAWQLAAMALEEATLPLLGEGLDLSRKISFEQDPSYIVDLSTRALSRFGE
jgi:hypothetical protein